MRISDWSSDVCSSDLTASELTIAPEAVDRERGVILSERRARDTYQLRGLIEQLAFQMPGMTVANRIPVGTEAVIRTAPAARLRDLYDRTDRKSTRLNSSH